MNIVELIKSRESETVEFKKSTGEWKEIIETISAFANKKGGVILVGVDKKLGLNERQIKAVMYVKKEGKITNKEYQTMFKVSKATATRDLSELVEKQIFNILGSGNW